MADARWSGGTLVLPSNCVTDEQVSSTATLDADKLQHLYKAGTNFATAIGGTPATREEIVFVASTSGTLRKFSAVLNETGTSTDIDFDLKKNGTTMLSAAVNVTHSDADQTVKDGTLSVTTVSADDILSISMTVTSATGAQGAFAWLEIEETAA